MANKKENVEQKEIVDNSEAPSLEKNESFLKLTREEALEENKRVKFNTKLLNANIPVLGICFGHQLIAHVLGGETTPAARGWGVGVHEFRVEDAPPWMSGKLGSFRLLCSHRDQVVRLPRDARVFARSDFCPVAGYTLGEHFVTFQGHPEFLKPYAVILMQSRKELLESAYDKGIASLAETTDEGLVATWMLEFFEQ